MRRARPQDIRVSRYLKTLALSHLILNHDIVCDRSHSLGDSGGLVPSSIDFLEYPFLDMGATKLARVEVKNAIEPLALNVDYAPVKVLHSKKVSYQAL